MRRLRALWLVVELSWRAAPASVMVVILFLLAESGAVAAFALAVRHVADRPSTPGVLFAAAAAGLAKAVSWAGFRLRKNLQFDISERVGVELEDRTLALIAGVPGLHHLEDQSYLDKVELVRTQSKEVASAVWAVADTARFVVSLVLSLVLLTTVDPSLLVLAVTVVPSILLPRWSRRRIRRAELTSARSARRHRHLFEACTGAEAGEIRVFRAGAWLRGEAATAWREETEIRARALVVDAIATAAGWAVLVGGFLLALLAVAALVRAGQASVGDLVLVITLITQLRSQVGGTLTGLTNAARGLAATDRFLWLRDYAAAQPLDTTAAPTVLTSGIELRGVGFSYGDRRSVLKGIDLVLPAGKVIALVGANGAGKTTLVKLLCGFYRPTEGEILVDGGPMPDLRSWHTGIAGVFQDHHRFELLVREAVGIGDLPRIDDPAAIGAAVDRGAATEVIATLPNGLHTQLGRTFGGMDLSGGQWQRISLARGRMRTKPLLHVLDEPAAALDAVTEHELIRRHAEIAGHGNAITVLVTHRLSTVRLADHVVVLDGGHIVEQGTHDDLLALDGQYARRYGEQENTYR
ncbi:ABC transporter ATP-binding protein [Lentzea sp. BCCO 10_0856]|uniref:ABC transporter ATP-binding protein n=1 Tax=Lentzea miocenica TaxID=3095431 RepID=A0ABU4T796_9PSEU|nr:ABC transporter ATP-binding protein [Lentzea sp. BCCO 10_0856]MDX8033837.1 ABC transporter ATP-binding protein [Lentzea sp. BCCO 10_0856]